MHRPISSRVATVVILATILVSGGCSSASDPAVATLQIGVENDLTNLDPIKSQEPYSLRVIGQIFEGLVTLNASNELEPALAESWSHNDSYDVWTFQIRRGVYFHEDESFGPERTREVTAQDVLESFERIVSKESYPSFVLADAVVGVQQYQDGSADHVAGFAVVGPQAFQVSLQQPEPAFLHRITSPWFTVFPREAVALGPDVFGRTKAIGTGPYKLVTRADNEVVLESNDRYWKDARPAFERVVFRVIKNDQIRFSELRNGNLSLMVLPPALIPAFVAERETVDDPYELTEELSGSFNVGAFPTFNSHFVGMNCDTMDVHLRRAISLAIDREEALRAVLHGAGTISSGTVPAGLLGYEPPLAGDILDRDAAAAELAQSNFDPATDTVELLVHDRDRSEQLGQLVQAQLGAIGIRVTIQKLDYNTVITRMIQGDTQAFVLAFEYVFSAPEPILNNIFNSEKIPVPNFWRYSNPDVDRGLADLRMLGDRTQANLLAKEVEAKIIEDAPAAFVYQLSNLVIYQRSVGGVAFNGHSIPLLWEVAPAGS